MTVSQDVVQSVLGVNGVPYLLPSVASWNAFGFGPRYWKQFVDKDKHIFPWFPIQNPKANRQIAAFQSHLEVCKVKGYPISFVGTQWERLLSEWPEYTSLPEEQNPNVIDTAGVRHMKVHPFASKDLWYEVGRQWTTTEDIVWAQTIYPNVPVVMFVSNNEHPRLRVDEVETCRQYLALHGIGKTHEEKVSILANGYVEMFRALIQGMKDGLTAPDWKSKSKYIGYALIGDGHMWGWANWKKNALYIGNNMWPISNAWDGASFSYYASVPGKSYDYNFRSPGVGVANMLVTIDERRQDRSDYIVEMSVWDGHEPNRPQYDTWKKYTDEGVPYNLRRHEGFTQLGMWIARPRVVREFKLAYIPSDEVHSPYFEKVLECVERVHQNPVLKDFWKNGKLVPNRDKQPLHQIDVTPAYQNADRWYRLDTSVDTPTPWKWEAEYKVYAIALVLGLPGARRWLLYAHSPKNAELQVSVSIPEYKSVAILTKDSGTFYVVDEVSGSVQDALSSFGYSGWMPSGNFSGDIQASTQTTNIFLEVSMWDRQLSELDLAHV